MQIETGRANSPSHNECKLFPQLTRVVSPTAAKIMETCPDLILSASHLYEYDILDRKITLSSPFRKLLALLVQINKLDKNSLTVESFEELNKIFQQPYDRGGLLRRSVEERCYLKDDREIENCQQKLENLLIELGFCLPDPIKTKMIVDYCIIFGSWIQPMETRIQETVSYLQDNLTVTGRIFLLGSNRLLDQNEKEYLIEKFPFIEEVVNEGETSESPRTHYWQKLFARSEECTEANAFMFLWEYLVPVEIRESFQGKVAVINSKKIGGSFQEQLGKEEGYRVTTDSTIEDLMIQIKNYPKIFALIEQPFIRLCGQLRFAILSNRGQANLQELADRIHSTAIYTGIVSGEKLPIRVILDEIGRINYNVFTKYLPYCESLETKEESSKAVGWKTASCVIS